MNKYNNEEFEKTCSAFIDTVNNYFTSLTSTASETGVPYLKDSDDLELKDYTGMIGVSGSKRGFVYISGKEGLYEDLIKDFIGITSPSKEDILDMSGELSNVVVGNLREVYGSNFMISVPAVFHGKPDVLSFPDDASIYVIPIYWKDHQADLVIALQ